VKRQPFDSAKQDFRAFRRTILWYSASAPKPDHDISTIMIAAYDISLHRPVGQSLISVAALPKDSMKIN
jgi:hypothetical protein